MDHVDTTEAILVTCIDYCSCLKMEKNCAGIVPNSFFYRWVRFGRDLELLDSPGIIPMRISDQSAAIKLAICDDIGERSYDVVDVAATLVQMLSRIPTAGLFQFFLQLHPVNC